MVTGELDVLGGTRLQVGYDNLTNNGTIVLNPSHQPEDAILVGWPYHNVTIGGTGEVVLWTAGDVNDARIETTGETMINGPQHTIRGEGAITCPFTNRGGSRPTRPAGALLLLGLRKSNEGLVEGAIRHPRAGDQSLTQSGVGGGARGRRDRPPLQRGIATGRSTRERRGDPSPRPEPTDCTSVATTATSSPAGSATGRRLRDVHQQRHDHAQSRFISREARSSTAGRTAT